MAVDIRSILPEGRRYLTDAEFARFERLIGASHRAAIQGAFDAGDQFYRPWMLDQRTRWRRMARVTWLNNEELAILTEIERFLVAMEVPV